VIVSACAELWEGRLRKSASLPVAALLGAGLASVSLHVALVLLWAVAVLALTVLFPKAAKASSLSRAGCAAAVLVLAGFTVGYSSIASASNAGRVVVLLASSALASVAALWPFQVVLRTGTFRVPDLTRGPAIQVASLCGAYAVGLLLLGNVLVHGAQGFLGALWPWPTVPVLDRFSTELVSPSQGLLQEPYCRQGFFWADRLLTGHCSSLSFFVRIYGLSIVLMTLVLAWKLLRDAKGQLAQDVRSTMMLWGMILSAVALPVAFVLFDFIGAVNPPADWNYGMGFLSTWLRSRLVEPWFYGGIALSLALFLRQATLRERRWAQSAMMICVALFALSPLMLPSQLVANMSYLLDAITW
jgi:hypothetical protein